MRLTLSIVAGSNERDVEHGEVRWERTVRLALENAAGPVGVALYANGWLEPSGPLPVRPAGSEFFLVKGAPENQGVAVGLHALYEAAREWHQGVPGDADLLVYLHDDVDILERGWDMRVQTLFAHHPDVALAGFGGARGLGRDDIYKTPYDHTNIHQGIFKLVRHDFMSNMEGAEIHGLRTTTEQEIATIDGFSMIVRRSLLDRIGGWSWFPYVHHAYDNAIACQVRRHKLKTWLLPIQCKHWGGKTACSPVHQEMAKKYGGDTQVHADAHFWLHENFRDVLPFRV